MISVKVFLLCFLASLGAVLVLVAFCGVVYGLAQVLLWLS